MIGDADETIIPWRSGLWEFYQEGEQPFGPVQPLNETALWNDDWIGLRALSESGRLELVTAPGVRHTDWTRVEAVFAEYVWPRLGRAPRQRL